MSEHYGLDIATTRRKRRDKGTDGSLRLGHLIPDELDRVGSMAGVHVGESRIHNVPLLVLVGVDY